MTYNESPRNNPNGPLMGRRKAIMLALVAGAAGALTLQDGVIPAIRLIANGKPNEIEINNYASGQWVTPAETIMSGERFVADTLIGIDQLNIPPGKLDLENSFLVVTTAYPDYIPDNTFDPKGGWVTTTRIRLKDLLALAQDEQGYRHLQLIFSMNKPKNGEPGIRPGDRFSVAADMHLVGTDGKRYAQLGVLGEREFQRDPTEPSPTPTA